MVPIFGTVLGLPLGLWEQQPHPQPLPSPPSWLPVHHAPRLQTGALMGLALCHFPWEMLWEKHPALFLVPQDT